VADFIFISKSFTQSHNVHTSLSVENRLNLPATQALADGKAEIIHCVLLFSLLRHTEALRQARLNTKKSLANISISNSKLRIFQTVYRMVSTRNALCAADMLFFGENLITIEMFRKTASEL
jgi:hypothetical protein